MASNILVVDDAESIRTDLNALLQNSGYMVTAASDGQLGLEAATSNEFDLIITYVNMPRMNGLEMIDHIRQTGKNSNTPIFVLTTESMRRFAKTCQELGAVVWIVKPYNPDMLLHYVGEFLSESAAN